MRAGIIAPAIWALAIWIGAATAQAAQQKGELAADPYAVMWAGDSLIALSEDQQLWRRDGGDKIVWNRIEMPQGLTVSNLFCASDASGICIVDLGTPGSGRTVVLDVATGFMRFIDTRGAEIVAMPDRNTAYLRAVDGDGTALTKLSLATEEETSVGKVAANEEVIFYPVDGALAPAAYSLAGHMRLVADDTPVMLEVVEKLIWLSDGLLLREAWSSEPPIVPGRRTVRHVGLHRDEGTSGEIIKLDVTTLGAWPVSGPLFDQSNGAADANDDVIVELLGGGVNQIAVLCRDSTGYAFKALADIQRDQKTTIVASQAGRGFVLRTTGLDHTPEFATLDLTPSPGGWRGRDCASTGYHIRPADVAVTTRTGATTQKGEALSADGTRVPWVALLPEGGQPDHVIIEVYGAYGTKHAFEAYQDMTIDQMKADHTAIVFAIVRGDGDLGYDYALASRSPDRHKAVEDTIAVAQAMASRFPALKSKPVVRGQSAGGWLAMRSALERPDLFSGAIGYAGAYLLDGDPLANNENRFFSYSDDLTPVVAEAKDRGACPGLKFRLLHARDDFRASYAKAEAFAALLTDAGCAVELVTFDSGGHGIEMLPHQMDQAIRRLKAYFGPL